MNHFKKRKDNGTRLLAALFMAVLMSVYLMVPNIEAKADNLIIAVSAQTIKIGDTLTVTVSVPAGVSATVDLRYSSDLLTYSSASDEVNVNAGTVTMTIGDYESGDRRASGTIKFQAKAAGNAGIAVSAPRAGNSEGDQVDIGAASTVVKVENEAEVDEVKSSDNALSSLTISEGTLSPAFQPDVLEYSAEVSTEVTSLVVSAVPRHEGASVESVEGADTISPGENKIRVVVKAENGVTATYTITVTQAAAENSDIDLEHCYEVDGVKLYPSSAVPEKLIPKNFEQHEIVLWDQTFPYYYNEKIGSQISLIYLVDENGENGALYMIAESAPYDAYPFVCLKSEYGYIIAVPDIDEETLPAGYQMQTLKIKKKGSVNAYFKPENQNLCLIFSVNQDGEYAWYQYDMNERTYIRYYGQEMSESGIGKGDTGEENNENQKLKSENKLIFWAFLVVAVILAVVIAVLTIKNKNRWKESDDEDELEDDIDWMESDEDENDILEVSPDVRDVDENKTGNEDNMEEALAKELAWTLEESEEAGEASEIGEEEKVEHEDVKKESPASGKSVFGKKKKGKKSEEDSDDELEFIDL